VRVEADSEFSKEFVMRYMSLLAVLGFAFFVGCATTKAPTSQQKIENVGRSFDDTDKRLSQAEKELKSFENSIGKLRKSAGSADRMRSKPEFDAALARLGSRIEQTHLDLQELKTANSRGRNTYDRQLDEAATEIQRSSAE